MRQRTHENPDTAKALVAQPLFRCQQQRPKKGKGSYNRKASRNREAFFIQAA